MIEALDKHDHESLKAVADLLQVTFPWSYADDDTALEEAIDLTKEQGIVLVYRKENRIIGVVGAKPRYGITGWELHPLAVYQTYQFQKVGSLLMEQVENQVRERGGIVMFLGTDDEHFKTSLSQVDLFENPFAAIEKIENYAQHPYEFYQKIGYRIVGVLPDANGFNKPDIYMAKRLVERPKGK